MKTGAIREWWSTPVYRSRTRTASAVARASKELDDRVRANDAAGRVLGHPEGRSKVKPYYSTCLTVKFSPANSIVLSASIVYSAAYAPELSMSVVA